MSIDPQDPRVLAWVSALVHRADLMCVKVEILQVMERNPGFLWVKYQTTQMDDGEEPGEVDTDSMYIEIRSLTGDFSSRSA